jgi:putative ABC transport system permease protein
MGEASMTELTASMFQSTSYAARGLRRDPLLLISATLTLAVCIGANTTIFSIANSILVRPLLYPGSERSDRISERSGPGNEDVGAAPAYYRLRDGNRVFEDVAAFNPVTVNWTSTERPEQMNAAVVSAPFFRSPATGRIRQRITELGNAGAEGE